MNILLLLAGTAVFAFLWTVARAAVQSITIDEADTYLASVAPQAATHWKPSANNHLLNSLLARLATTVFGGSALTLRLPALAAAFLYIAAAYCLARLLTRRRWLQWATLVCLTCSPFVMDYLVAARLRTGVGLPLVDGGAGRGFRPARRGRAKTAPGPHVRADFGLRRAGHRGQLLVCRGRRHDGSRAILLDGAPESRQIAPHVPAVHPSRPGVGYFLVGSIVMDWPKGQFTWGADSFLKVISSLVNASLFEPNNYLLHEPIDHYFVHFGTWLYPLLLAMVLWRAGMAAFSGARLARHGLRRRATGSPGGA